MRCVIFAFIAADRLCVSMDRFNQATVAYDATKEERVDALKANMAEKEKQFKVKE